MCWILKVCINMILVELPTRIIEKIQKQEVTEGSAATFKCRLSKPGQKVTWCKNGKALSAKDYKIASKDTEHTLTIYNAKLDDVAQYSISFSDEKSSAQLVVKGINFSALFIMLC